MIKHPDYQSGKQASESVSAFVSTELQLFLQPLLVWLNQQMDKQLVRTFVQTPRLKLLLMATLAYAFLLSLLHSFLSQFAPGSYASFAIEPKSGTERSRCRFIVFAPL